MERGEGFFSEILEEGTWACAGCAQQPASDLAELAESFKESMRRLAAGICAVTVERGGEHFGFTATSVTSLSMDPPSLLVSIRDSSRVLPVLRKERRFDVHLLTESQTQAANALAGRLGEGARIQSLGELLGPGQSGVLGRIVCRIEKFLPVFSHVLLAGVVEEVRLGHDTRPLIYFGGEFRGLGHDH